MTVLQNQLLEALKKSRQKELVGVEVHQIIKKARELMSDEDIMETLGFLPVTSLAKGEDVVYSNAMNAMGYAGW